MWPRITEPEQDSLDAPTPPSPGDERRTAGVYPGQKPLSGQAASLPLLSGRQGQVETPRELPPGERALAGRAENMPFEKPIP